MAMRTAVWALLALGLTRSLFAAEQLPLNAEQAAAVWNTATTEIGRIEKRLEELQAAFPTAKPEDQQKLRTEALQLIEEIKAQFRNLGRAVPAVYAEKVRAEGGPAQPAPGQPNTSKTHELAEQSLGLAYSENRYSDAARIADALLAVDPKDAVALNVGGVSQFATHQFSKAVEMLERAKQDNLLIPDLGGNYLDSAKNYVKYWETEQALRAKEDAAAGDAQLPRVTLHTSRGDIVVELFEDQAPNTVANFISLVEKGYYNGSPFHRVIENFMAQGGTPGNNPTGAAGPGYTITCECYRPDARRHFAGTLSMAHAGKDTGGSQFFITHLPTPHLDREVRPESVHTVFGRVLQGMDVVAAIQQGDQIVTAEVMRKRNHPYVPVTQPSRQ